MVACTPLEETSGVFKRQAMTLDNLFIDEQLAQAQHLARPVETGEVVMGTNGYKDGFDKGYYDSVNGESKDGRPNLVKAIISENYRDEHAKGYEEGYRKGSHDKNKM